MSQVLCSTSTNSNAINSDDDIDEYTTENGFILKLLSKNSNQEVWKYYGKLFKGSKIVQAMDRRMVCKLCFDKNQIKR